MSPVPVPFAEADAAELLAGRPTAHRFDTDGGAYATGAVWIDAPIEAVWIAIQDAPHDPPGRMTFARLDAPAGMRRVHATLDLPYPLADRQWVSDVTTAKRLYDATGGQVWQRQWSMGDPTLVVAPDPKAAWLTENRGAWTLVDADGGTLALFSVRTVLGGLIPQPIAQAWAIGTIKSSMTDLAVRAKGMPAHYVAGHEVVRTPEGGVIPYW
jgi:hypothetical protein